MGDWKIIEPVEIVQLISNPSIENAGTTGWTAVGSGLARVITEQKFGVASLEIDTANAAIDEGAYYTVNPPTASVDHTASIWVKRDAGGTVNIRLRDQTNGNETVGAVVTLTAAWQRIEVTHTLTGASADLRLYIETDVQQNITFYADAAQIEEQSEATTYCDGDQSGCEWLGGDHASISLRSAIARAGGFIRDLKDDFSFGVADVIGAGMAPLALNLRPFSLIPGAELGSTKVQSRRLTLVGNLKGVGADCDIYEARDDLLAVLIGDPFVVNQPARLRFTGADNDREIDVYYQSGLGGNQRAEWTDIVEVRVPLQFVAVSPYWMQVGEQAVALDVEDTLGSMGVAARLDGQWTDIDYAGALKATETMELGLDRLLYWGGDFVDLGGIAEADYLAKYDPITNIWTAVAAGGTEAVRTIAVAPDGTIYFAGDFVDWNAIPAADYIASWNGAAYAAVLAGGTGNVDDIAIDPTDGSIAIGGNFVNWNTVATADYIVKYDAPTAAWVDLTAAGACNNRVHAVAYAPDGTLYAGGEFTNIGGVAINRVAKWDGTVWTALGTGLNFEPWVLVVADDGTLYAGGDFTTAGGLAVGYIAKWDGNVWTALGDGFDDSVGHLALAPNNDIIAVGDFKATGSGIPADGMARWNGSVWSAMDSEVPGIVLHVVLGFFDPIVPNKYDIFIDYSGQGNAPVAGVVTLTNNGNVSAFPRITINRAGGTSARLLSIRNETSGLELLFNIALLDGETITINLPPGNKTITSNWRGNLVGSLLPNSDFAKFVLIPGSNKISAFVPGVGAPTITAHIIWQELY